MSSSLKLDFAPHEAAKFACENWHYSKCLPTGKLVKIGVWEDDKFIGVVIFSRGASPHLGTKFELSQYQLCELTRVALHKHKTPVSRILSIALRMLSKFCPGIDLVVSFADPNQGHHGGIYQATNWIFAGSSNPTVENFVRGKWRHMRGSYHEAKALGDVPQRTMPGKYRYLFPLNDKMRADVEKYRKPYPKREDRPIGRTAPSPGDNGGPNPTSSLQNNC